MRGGYQRVVAALGKDNAKLDITSVPKRILITGSDNDVELARNALNSQDLETLGGSAGQTHGGDEDLLCAVCWTPAEDLMNTSCGHTYCSHCFDSQVASTEDFQMICLGDSGNCKTPISVQELRRILSASSYNTSLETALTKYIRKNPEVGILTVS
jgi:hypothetical protein